MATINGITFNLKNLSIISSHRNIVSEQPGSDTNYITDMGYNGLELRLDGYEETEAVYDNVITEFMKTGGQTLVHRSGWQYTVYSIQHNPTLLEGIVDNYFPYDLTLITSTPYRESTSETTRPKTITTNNQEWSQDNSANDIDTDGSVNAIPDIKITGGAAAATLKRTYGFGTEDTDATEYDMDDEFWVLRKTFTYTAKPGIAYNLATVGLDQRISQTGQTCYCKVTYQAASLAGGVETTVQEWTTTGTGYIVRTTNPDIQAALNENLVIKFYMKISDSVYVAYMKNLVSTIEDRRVDICKNPQIYNIADTTVKSDIANEVLVGAIYKINVDGTGTIDLNDDFTGTEYLDNFYDMIGVTHDAGNDELDIADNGYLYFQCDAKYPITGVPILTSQINITAGTPTIQISSDASTWYDITTAIVDDVNTVYDLDNSSLSLKGLTMFYWRFDCIKAGVATCSIKTFELDVDNITIDVEHPVITTSGAASTFRCNQHADSGLNCTISLIYRDRSWPV